MLPSTRVLTSSPFVEPVGQGRDHVVECPRRACEADVYGLERFCDHGRLYRTLIDSSIGMDDLRDSLDSRAFIAKHLRPQYDGSLLGGVVRLQVFARTAVWQRGERRAHAGWHP